MAAILFAPGTKMDAKCLRLKPFLEQSVYPAWSSFTKLPTNAFASPKSMCVFGM